MSRSSLIVLVVAAAFAARIFWHARRQRTHERHTLFWLAVCAFVAGLAVWREGIEKIAAAMGIDYPPSALFLISLAGLVYVVYMLSLELSEQRRQLRRLAQELAVWTASKPDL